MELSSASVIKHVTKVIILQRFVNYFVFKSLVFTTARSVKEAPRRSNQVFFEGDLIHNITSRAQITQKFSWGWVRLSPLVL
jgi:hypothetical protein